MNDYTKEVEVEVIAMKAMKYDNITIKAGTILKTRLMPLHLAEAYFRDLARKKDHKTAQNLRSIAKSAVMNPTLSSGYGLNENGLLVENGKYSINHKLNLVERKETKTEKSK